MTTAMQDKGAVVVTGASRGAGASIAEQLAGDGYGMIVSYAADAGCVVRHRRYHRPRRAVRGR